MHGQPRKLSQHANILNVENEPRKLGEEIFMDAREPQRLSKVGKMGRVCK